LQPINIDEDLEGGSWSWNRNGGAASRQIQILQVSFITFVAVLQLAS
jgi:hypothetical protein